MKDIKFRAWVTGRDDLEKEIHKMIEVGGLVGVHLGGAVTEEYDFGDTLWWGNYELMQYTGLKDKNSKEIYEGDIVRLGGWWDAAGPAGYDKPEVTVEWNEDNCGFDPFANYDSDCGVFHSGEECEVIGNIYQNPELLGDKE